MKYLIDNDLNNFIEFLKINNIQMKPCTEKEIEVLKGLAKEKKLPETYLEFMKEAGNGIRFLQGSSYTMKEILNLKEWANELLEENNVKEIISDNQVVFFMHQGYQFCFFNLDDGENPPIYYYGEGEGLKSFIKKNDTLAEWLIEYYNDLEYLLK